MSKMSDVAPTSKSRRVRRKFTDEFRAGAVRPLSSDKPLRVRQRSQSVDQIGSSPDSSNGRPCEGHPRRTTFRTLRALEARRANGQRVHEARLRRQPLADSWLVAAQSVPARCFFVVATLSQRQTMPCRRMLDATRS